jgi:aryl sulfotransferase
MDESGNIYRCLASDSSRWRGFALRPGDIIISTPAKCGTTWTQRICSLIIFKRAELDGPMAEISPWLDMSTRTCDEVFADLEAQQHRRFIKTHTPLAGLPQRDDVQYICVGRDPRDVGISWDHHLANLDMEAFLAARARVVGTDDLEEMLELDPPSVGDTLEERFWSWVDKATPPHGTGSSLWSTLDHMEQAYAARDRHNVSTLHYADLKADLEGAMRYLADWLGEPIDESLWPELVEAAGFETMKKDASQLAPSTDIALWKESEGFFHSGRGGGWQSFFDDEAQARYDTRASSLASEELLAWAHR